MNTRTRESRSLPNEILFYRRCNRSSRSRFKPEFIEEVARLRELALTDHELAAFLNADVVTFYQWCHEYPAFADAARLDMTSANRRVARALYSRLKGPRHEP